MAPKPAPYIAATRPCRSIVFCIRGHHSTTGTATPRVPISYSSVVTRKALGANRRQRREEGSWLGGKAAAAAWLPR